jgi:hypothetical protein
VNKNAEKENRKKKKKTEKKKAHGDQMGSFVVDRHQSRTKERCSNVQMKVQLGIQTCFLFVLSPLLRLKFDQHGRHFL